LSRPAWLLVAVPVLLHLPDLAGILSSDPLPMMSGLALHPHDWLEGAVLQGRPGWIDGNAGITLQALGRLVARDWLHGVVPWWNPYSGVGMPLAGEYQPAAFFLPFILLAGLPNDPLLLKFVLQMVGGFSMFSLLGEIALARPAALVGGVLFELNGTFAWSGDSPMLPVAFIPLALLGVERARRGLWRTFAVAIAYLLLAGFPETAFLGGLLVLAWAGLRFAQARTNRWRFAARLGVGGGVGLAVAAPQLVAFLDYLPDAFLGDHAATVDFPLPAAGWAAFLFPYVNGTIFFGDQFSLWFSLGGFIGITTALLALCGSTGRSERSLRLLLLGWIFVALLRIGDAPVVTPLLNAVPLLGRTFFYRYSLPSISTAAIVLAALAIDDWLSHGLKRIVVIFAIDLAAALAAIAVLADGPTLAGLRRFPHGGLYAFAAIAWGSAAALTTAAMLARPATRRRRFGLMAVVLADAAALYIVPLLSGRADTALDLPTIRFLQERVGLQRVMTLGPLSPNYGAYFGLATITYNAVPIPLIWLEQVRATLDTDGSAIAFDGVHPVTDEGRPRFAALLASRTESLEALGVGYVLVPPGLDISDAEVVWRGAAATILQLPNPAPYAQSKCRLTITDRTEMTADCTTAATLIRRELFLPGWTALVNGSEVPITPMETVFQVVGLPAGHSVIRFAYAPVHAPLGWMALAAGLVILLVGGSSAPRRHSPRRSSWPAAPDRSG
jgi:hypothetical protein